MHSSIVASYTAAGKSDYKECIVTKMTVDVPVALKELQRKLNVNNYNVLIEVMTQILNNPDFSYQKTEDGYILTHEIGDGAKVVRLLKTSI